MKFALMQQLSHIYILHNNYIVLDIGTLENVPLSLDLIHIYRITYTDCAV